MSSMDLHPSEKTIRLTTAHRIAAESSRLQICAWRLSDSKSSMIQRNSWRSVR